MGGTWGEQYEWSSVDEEQTGNADDENLADLHNDCPYNNTPEDGSSLALMDVIREQIRYA